MLDSNDNVMSGFTSIAVQCHTVKFLTLSSYPRTILILTNYGNKVYSTFKLMSFFFQRAKMPGTSHKCTIQAFN